MPLTGDRRASADLEATVAARFAALGLADGGPLGIAVSGGGDSMGLLHLTARLCPACNLHAVTVDHGLRLEAAAEAASVAKAAAALHMPHQVLRWTGWDGTGNLQNAARQARTRLIADWARERGISTVLLGHTRDDQAETVLLRLARGSGVDGLAAMRPVREACGVTWVRPLLEVPREALRAWLRAEGVTWCEDPSNDDLRFDRVRARRLLSNAADLGLDAGRLADTAERMAAARTVLAGAAADAARRLVRTGHGALWLAAGWEALADDTRWRLLAAALCQVSGTAYRPSFAALCAAEAAVKDGRNHTLHSCHLVPEGDDVRVQPELKALAAQTGTVPGAWAGWVIAGPSMPHTHIAPLGPEGLATLPSWRDSGLPHRLACTLPGIWTQGHLVAAPSILPGKWQATPAWDAQDFAASLLSD